MEKAEVRSAIARRLRVLLSQLHTLPRELRPYQVEALNKIASWLEDPNSSERAYIEHATGLGKTELFAALVNACVGLRCLIIVPTKTLIEQTARRVVQYTGGMIGHVSSLRRIKDEAGEIIAIRGHAHHAVVVTTDDSFRRYSRELLEDFDPDLIVRDECHGGYTAPEQQALKRFSRATVLALTATPDYLGNIARDSYTPVTLDNGRLLYAPPGRLARDHFGTCLDQRNLRWGIEEGFLAPLAWGHVDFDISLDKVPVVNTDSGPDYKSEDLRKLLSRHWPFMVDTITELYRGGEYGLPERQVYAVCDSVQAAYEIAEAIQALGVPSACVTGSTKDGARNAILQGFDACEVRFVSSVMVLREGWDAPNAEVCMMLRPTRSRVLYMQNMGRIARLRRDGAFKCAMVMDAHYLRSTFAPLSAPMLFGQPGQVIESGGILIGPSTEYVPTPLESPYKTVSIKPKMIVVPAEYHLEHWAGTDGTCVIDGEVYGTYNGLAVLLGTSIQTLKSRSTGCRNRPGKDSGGHSTVLHALQDLKKACADILDPEIPMLDKKSLVEIQGKIWGTEFGLSERLKIDRSTIAHRCSDCPRKPARSCQKRPVVILAEEDVKSACQVFFDQELPRLGEDDTAKKDGKILSTIANCAKLLQLSHTAVNKRVGQLTAYPGIDRSGRPATLYEFLQVKKACGNVRKYKRSSK